jgi:hypothetical protein
VEGHDPFRDQRLDAALKPSPKPRNHAEIISDSGIAINIFWLGEPAT